MNTVLIHAYIDNTASFKFKKKKKKSEKTTKKTQHPPKQPKKNQDGLGC